MAPARLLWIAASAALAAAPGPVHAADPLAGRALFIGARPLAHGGPPCRACHAVGGASAPFAATMGPELSRSFDGMDADAVDALLRDLPFPTMAPLYGTAHALTDAERADLGAFVVQASGKPPPGGAAIAAWAAAIAAVALLALSRVARRSKGSTRAELLARVRARPAPRGGVR